MKPPLKKCKKCKKCKCKCKCNLFTHGAPRSSQTSFRNVRAFKDRIGIREMLVFEERGKPEYPEKNLSEQRREPTTNSAHIWRRVRELNPGHIGGRRVLSPLRHPYSPTHWERRQLIEFISSRAEWNDVRYIYLSNCINWKIYCDDHSSLSSTTAVQIWIISYILHITLYCVCHDLFLG